MLLQRYDILPLRGAIKSVLISQGDALG